ncbi:hypothetical protein HCN44_003954 [Aphidius gifuensis]|uniref:Equilibrative nucleoside transporter n=1 Tax=Aphidius gifuensis TaxID=684658 RepID=A0A834XXS6_APHGI|nr:hypothetical protein HCN44_003954 [Aphidius gifuensis]
MIRYNQTLYYFFLLGISTYVPWFFFMNAQTYWDFKLRNVTLDNLKIDKKNETLLQGYYTSYMSIASAIPFSLFLIINVFLCKWVSTKIRAIVTQLLVIILFIITTIFVQINTDNWQIGFLIITLSTLAGLNALGSTFAGTMFGVVGHFPSKYISSFSQGQAVSGIFAAIFQILSLWLSTGPIATGLMYFLIGDFIIIFAFISYIFLEKQEFFKYHMKEEVTIKNSDKSVDDTPSSGDNNSVSYMKILVKIWPYGLAMFLTFFITYSIYPVINTRVESEAPRTTEWGDKYFLSVGTFLMFSIGEYVGCLLSRYSSLLDGKPWFSLKSRVISTQTIVLVLLIITTLFIYINTDGWQEYFFFFTLLLAFLINAFSTIFYGALVTITGLFSPNYITAYSAGQALSGIITTLIQILSLWIGMTHETSAFIYFMIGNVGILCSILAYILLEKQKFFKSHVYKHQNIQKKKINTGDVEETKIEYKKIFKIIWPHGLSMFLLYGVTYCVYPSINVLIKSQMAPSPNEWSDKYFTPVATYLSFNCGDYFGRLVAGYFLWPNKKYMLVLITLLRILFIPTFMICNIKSEINILPILIDNDIIYTFLVFLFSTSNGYMCNILYQHVPKIVELQDEEVAMGFLGVFLGLGIAIGSGISVPIVNMLE